MRGLLVALVIGSVAVLGCGGGGGGKKKKKPKGPEVTWTPGGSGASVQPVDLPYPAASLTLSHTVYDSDNDRLVCYAVGAWGDETGTWTYDFSTKKWTKINTANNPGLRFYFAMAYMPNVGVVLYGGFDGNNFLTDTWVFNGSDWQQINTSANPTSSIAGCMCYDSKNSRILYFGGVDSQATYQNELWAFNGTDWSQVTTSGTAPSARAYAAMAFDSTNNIVVLYGGVDGNDFLSDTWELDVTNNDTWTEVTTSGTAPPGLDRHAMAYDGTKIVLVGGWNDTAYNADIYTYDVAQDEWSQTVGPTPVGSPPDNPNLQRINAAVFKTSQGFFIFGGQDNQDCFLCDLWQWDGTDFHDWTLPGSYPHPAPRWLGGLAYLKDADKVILFGGEGPYGRMYDVWEYDPANDTWTMLTPGGVGPVVGRSQTAMCELGTDKVISVGGLDGNSLASNIFALSYSGGTYTWDSPATLQVQATAAAYDPNKGLVGIFGGYNNGVLSDTNSFDGTNVQSVNVNAPPAGRLWHAMAYHPTLQKLIIFGGAMISGGSITNAFSDTWSLTLTTATEGTWELMSTLNTPTARFWHAMAPNDTKHVIVMCGGYDPGNDAVLEDAWVLDERGRWLQCGGTGPGKRMGHMMSKTGGLNVLLFGGTSGATLLGSWLLASW